MHVKDEGTSSGPACLAADERLNTWSPNCNPVHFVLRRESDLEAYSNSRGSCTLEAIKWGLEGEDSLMWGRSQAARSTASKLALQSQDNWDASCLSWKLLPVGVGGWGPGAVGDTFLSATLAVSLVIPVQPLMFKWVWQSVEKVTASASVHAKCLSWVPEAFTASLGLSSHWCREVTGRRHFCLRKN